MNFTLKIWRQKDAKTKGGFETYKVENISADTSFLEMLDILNNNLIHEGKEPVAFDHDCREGICGMCSLHIDGHAHGPGQAATTCQIYMRKFKDGATITIEPWRSAAFPVIKDLVVNRSAYDQILQAGGFISVRLHRLRRLRGNLQERFGDALRRRPRIVARQTAAGPCGGCTPRQGDGRQDGRAGLRQLHQHGCLPSRVPQVDFDRAHRAPEPRVPLREVRRLIKVPEQSGKGREAYSRPFSCPGTQTLASCPRPFIPGNTPQ